jgi:hypothetical protein
VAVFADFEAGPPDEDPVQWPDELQYDLAEWEVSTWGPSSHAAREMVETELSSRGAGVPVVPADDTDWGAAIAFHPSRPAPTKVQMDRMRERGVTPLLFRRAADPGTMLFMGCIDARHQTVDNDCEPL